MDWKCTSLWFLLILEFLEQSNATCIFSEKLRESRWHTKIKPTESRRTAVRFTNTEMISDEEEMTSGRIISTNRRDCVEMVDIDKYLFRFHDESSSSERYGCLQIIWRGSAVFQLMFSELHGESKRDYCMDSNLHLNAWPFVSFSLAKETFVTCPLFGGYNMKVQDSHGVDNGCNFMDLPMRFESECIIGEGLIFDFRSSDCVTSMSMDSYQRSACVSHWEEGGSMLSVIRKVDTDDMWCLRYDLRQINTNHFSVFLYTDFVCSSDVESTSQFVFYVLSLERIVQSTLCADEYSRCEKMTCLPIIEEQCQKSCGACSVPPDSCSFPRRLRGKWYLNDKFGSKIVTVMEHKVSIDDFGSFNCISFDDSPPKGDKKFTTVSMFSNGCRPRYTCLKFERLGHSIYGMALSQSNVWPLNDPNPGSRICHDTSFRQDSEPFSDSYRSNLDSVKPIVPVNRWGKPIKCPLPNVMKINATMNDGTSCHGNMYRDCDNSSRLGIDMNRCRSQLVPLDYLCITSFKGRYWEDIVIIQNMADASDVRCIIFTELHDEEAIILPAAQCDQNSWTFSNAGLRTPLMHIKIKSRLAAECYALPSNSKGQNDEGNSNTQLLPIASNKNKTVTSPDNGSPDEQYTTSNKHQSKEKKSVFVSSTKHQNSNSSTTRLSAGSFYYYIFCVLTIGINLPTY